MKLDLIAAETLRALRRANGASFTDLIKIAGLDPARDLRDTDLTGVNFAGCDLTGYDFSGARLAGASFVGASIERTIFDRAETTGVTWPHGWRPVSAGRTRRDAPAPLQPWQREIAGALVKELRTGPAARAVAVLPPGVGKSTILAEVFRSMTGTKAFRRGLILTETVAQRDQLMHVLRERGVDTADVEGTRDRRVILPGETLVETWGNYGRMLDELEFAEEPTNPLKCTHLALNSLPTRRRSAIATLTTSPDAPATLAFIEATLSAAGVDDHRMRGRLGDVFERITYKYEIQEAVADGVLVPSELIDRSHTISALGDWRGGFDQNAAKVLAEVASDFQVEIDRAPEGLAALLVMPDSGNAQLLADELRSQLLRAGMGIGEPPKVTVLAPKTLRDDWLQLPRSYGIVIATSALADDLNLAEFGLVGVLTGLPDRLATKLRLPPARWRAGERIRVLDYIGNVADLATGDLIKDH